MTAIVEETIKEHWEPNTLFHVPPLMGGEDFSAFSQAAPASFILIGAGNESKGMVYPHHHPNLLLTRM